MINNKAGKLLAFMIFNGALIGAAQYKNEIETGYTGLKAILWYMSAPVCQVNNFCLKVDSDRSVGGFVDSTVYMDSFWGKYSTIKTDEGEYVVSGIANHHDKNSNVRLLKEGNKLCIGQDCYLIPTGE